MAAGHDTAASLAAFNAPKTDIRDRMLVAQVAARRKRLAVVFFKLTPDDWFAFRSHDEWWKFGNFTLNNKGEPEYSAFGMRAIEDCRIAHSAAVLSNDTTEPI